MTVSESSPDYDAIVIGAGVGGAALALALSYGHGARVLLVERRSGPGNINRGDSVLPAITRHLAAWGVLDDLHAAGAAPVRKMQVFHAERGFLMEAPLCDPAGHPYVVLPHPEIERVLTEGARRTGRVEVRYLTKLGGLIERAPDGRVVGVELVDREGRTTRATARLVIGADGSSSVVRHRLGIGFTSRAYPAGYYIIDFERPADYEDAMRLHLHRQGGVMIVPQQGGVVGVAALVHAAEADLFRAGTLEDKVAALRRRCATLKGCAPLPRHAHLYTLSRGHASAYVRQGAALIGDAVHVTNPTAGQGMTMAVEDAAALARHVGPLLAAAVDDGLLDRGLAAYERERRPLNQGLVRWSHVMGRFFAAEGAVADGVRARVFAFGQTAAGQWVQRRIWDRVATRPSLAPAHDPAPAPPLTKLQAAGGGGGRER
jgi:2-polyprenyl-6-methoxyphenol hydroxylase-like FAD-dependent oxidoreductase